MKKKKAIFQMSIIKNTNNIPGLIFSSELENYQSQNIQFCIPINKSISSLRHLIDYLYHFDIYMPFSYKNDIVNIPAIINFPYLEFDLRKNLGINSVIKFEIEMFNNQTRRRPIRRRTSQGITKFKIHILRLMSSAFPKLNYLGNWPYIDKKRTQFILLNPIDLKGLNECYKKYQILPVGGTLNFGLDKFYVENKNIERDYEK